MSITLNHSLKETCKITFSASAQIEYKEGKSYKLSLQLIRNRNTLAYQNIILEKGSGTVEINYDYSAYQEDGISFNVTADVTEQPSSELEPGSGPDPNPETEIVPDDVKGIVIDTISKHWDLFGLYDCLDYIDFQHNFSYRRQTTSQTLQSIKACAAIFLKKGYRLISIVDGSGDLTYDSTHSSAISPKWDITIISNLVVFHADLPAEVPTYGFLGFNFKAAGLILQESSGLALMLPLVLDNR